MSDDRERLNKLGDRLSAIHRQEAEKEQAEVAKAESSRGVGIGMRIGIELLQRLDAVMGEHEIHRTVADLAAEFLQHQRLEIGLVIDDKDGRGHAECPSRESIS